MNKWLLTALTLCALLALGFFLSRDPAGQPGGDLQPTPPSLGVAGTARTAPAADSRPAPVVEPEEPQDPARGKIEAYLSSRGRDVGSLLGAWALTGDRGFLEEAAARFPSSPLVIMSQLELGEKERADLLQRLMRVDPNNELPVLLAMTTYWREGNQDGLQAMARRLVDLEGFSDYRVERVAEAEKAAQALGLSGAQAVATALDRVGDGQQVLFKVQEAQQVLLAGMRGVPLAIGPAAAGEALLRLGTGLLDPAPCGSLARQVQGAQILLDTLEAMAEGGLKVDGDLYGRTSEQWIRRATELREAAPVARRRINEGRWLSKAAPWQQEEFTRLYREQGEENALRWAQSFLPAR
jgi:hypothetical protein